MIINKTTICIILVVLLFGLMAGFIIGQNVNSHSNNSIVTKSDVVGTYKTDKYDLYSPGILVLKKDGICFFPGSGTATWEINGDFVIVKRQYADNLLGETTSTYEFTIVDGGLYLGSHKKLFEKIE